MAVFTATIFFPGDRKENSSSKDTQEKTRE